MTTENSEIAQVIHESSPVMQYGRVNKIRYRNRFKDIFEVGYKDPRAQEVVSRRLDYMRTLANNAPEPIAVKTTANLFRAKQTAVRFGFDAETSPDQTEQ